MADFNEYKGVWVFCEQRQGALMSTDFELVSEARKLADELGCEVTGLLLGDNVEGIAKELGGYGADKVMVCDSPLLKDYTTDAYAKVVCDMVNEYKPEVLLIGATNIGRDLGPRCAARLHTGLTADAQRADRHRGPSGAGKDPSGTGRRYLPQWCHADRRRCTAARPYRIPERRAEGGGDGFARSRQLCGTGHCHEPWPERQAGNRLFGCNAPHWPQIIKTAPFIHESEQKRQKEKISIFVEINWKIRYNVPKLIFC